MYSLYDCVCKEAYSGYEYAIDQVTESDFDLMDAYIQLLDECFGLFMDCHDSLAALAEYFADPDTAVNACVSKKHAEIVGIPAEQPSRNPFFGCCIRWHTAATGT